MKKKAVCIYNQYLERDNVVKLDAHSNNCLYNFYWNCKCINMECVTEFKYLGVILNQNFKGNTHMNEYIRKNRIFLLIANKLKFVLSDNVIRNIYFSLANSLYFGMS